jgi:hypothetical protein
MVLGVVVAINFSNSCANSRDTASLQGFPRGGLSPNIPWVVNYFPLCREPANATCKVFTERDGRVLSRHGLPTSTIHESCSRDWNIIYPQMFITSVAPGLAKPSVPRFRMLMLMT